MQNQISERARKLGSNSVKKTERNTSHEWDGGAAPKLPPCRGQKDPVRRFQLPLLKPISGPVTANLSERISSLRSLLETNQRCYPTNLGVAERPVGPDQHRHEDNFALCSSISDLEQDLRFCLRSTPMIINLVGDWGTSPPIPGPVGGSTRQKLKI